VCYFASVHLFFSRPWPKLYKIGIYLIVPWTIRYEPEWYRYQSQSDFSCNVVKALTSSPCGSSNGIGLPEPEKQLRLVKAPGNLVMVPKSEGGPPNTVYLVPHQHDSKKLLVIKSDDKLPIRLAATESAATSLQVRYLVQNHVALTVC